MRGVGIDIVEVARMAKKLEKPAFLNLAFTQEEQNYCLQKANAAECFAARFAAKEAYMKALGEGWSNRADFKEIEVMRTDLGQPKLRLHGKTKSFFLEQNFQQAALSISHTTQTAVAVVILT